MKFFKARWIVTFIVVVLLGLYLYSQSGYSISETKALKKSFPDDNGVVVNEQRFKNNKIVFWKGQHGTYAKLIHEKWNFFYQVRNVAALSSAYPDETIKRTWTANKNSNEMFNTMLAVEITDPSIIKVIVTNENIDNEILQSLDEINKISSIYLELSVDDGYASAYQELEPADVGAFVFRGIDENGVIKYIGR